jgi:hypothetical protein
MLLIVLPGAGHGMISFDSIMMKSRSHILSGAAGKQFPNINELPAVVLFIGSMHGLPQESTSCMPDMRQECTNPATG